LPGKIELKVGDRFTLTVADWAGSNEKVQVSHRGLIDDVKVRDSILIDDGLVELKVREIVGEELNCEVINGGIISSRKGVNVPGVDINLPALTGKDINDICFGVEQGIDFIAASFIRKAEDVLAIKEILEEKAADIDVIAKIENQAGVDNIDDIINVADGIMVARGDLGVEIPAEEVPLVQKMIIEKCNNEAKPVITATQMLDSMIRNPRPTRAEASDVANAIFDGTDAIMLSGETAAGSYPVEAVKTMTKIALRAEKELKEKRSTNTNTMAKTITDAIGYATREIAQELNAAAIITSTKSGSTARMVSKYRPNRPIIAVTPSREVMRKMQLVWGVKPLQNEDTDSTDEMFREAIAKSLNARLVKTGELVIITAGVPTGTPGTTNLLKVHVVSEILAKGIGIGKGVISGELLTTDSAEIANQKVNHNTILVTKMTDKDFIPSLTKAAAFVTVLGGITSHAAIVSLNLGKPVIIGIGDDSAKLKDGMTVTLDVSRGLIFEGLAKVL
ncbi:MAG: pyruvate kinase, partial [Bacillota bacterium]|nr:pyruvate kinase [Bacillota bacterium]